MAAMWKTNPIISPICASRDSSPESRSAMFHPAAATM